MILRLNAALPSMSLAAHPICDGKTVVRHVQLSSHRHPSRSSLNLSFQPVSSDANGGGDGIRTRDDMEPRHYPRQPDGLKSASLLGPHWLFRCIRKDPARHLLPCPDITPPVPITFPGACAESQAGAPIVPHSRAATARWWRDRLGCSPTGIRRGIPKLSGRGDKGCRDDRLSPPGARSVSGVAFQVPM
jgi:hypothetical protein